VLTATGWWWAGSRPRAPREAGLDVLLITIDTLRADSLGSYGQTPSPTPSLDALAAAGRRFTQAHAHNVVTLPSHANILSGRHPWEHGVRDNSGFVFPAGIDTLATILAARGYRTGAFVSAFPLDSRFGLARGFDVYEDSFVDATARPAFLEQDRRGADTVALARKWLEADQTRPSFCWLHLYDPHYPYDPPPGTPAQASAYLGEVAATDAALAPLLRPLLERGRDGRTLVVLTSDHGEALGDHGEATHGLFAYEPVLRVPLIVFAPRIVSPGTDEAPARHVDILPTILDAVGLPVPGGLPGRALLATRPAPGQATYFEALSASLNRGWAPLHGVIRDGTKYVDLPIPELYDLAADPREERNLADAQPRRAADLFTLLTSLRTGDRGPQRGAVSAETLERLRGLGYVSSAGDRSAARATEHDDPKRLIGLDTKLQDVAGRYQAGDLVGAIAVAREVVRARPGMAIGWLYLAHLERDAGDLAAGIDALGTALALMPGDVQAASLLGAYLTEAGRAADAVAVLEPFVRREPPDPQVLTTHALALARTQRFGDARAALERARRADPTNAALAVHEGTIELIAGDRDRARAAFTAAVAQNPGLARAHASLGMIAGEEGRTEAALGHWKAAVAIDAREAGKLLPLAGLLLQRGRPAEARAYLELFVSAAPPSLFAADLEKARAWLAHGRM
jgi:arylsulfatase A-like enzyme/cytochrome c-type biogenesis protein CcmH/NrfG